MSKKVQLTITQKLEIIDEIEQKHTDQAVLAKRYGVDRCTVYRIHTTAYGRHVGSPTTSTASRLAQQTDNYN